MSLVRVTVDVPDELDSVVRKEADKQHRTRKDQYEYIIQKWCEEAK